ncbi:MAG: sigma-70 family RNA polymerase sigma factor [Planctomycetota bacterium]
MPAPSPENLALWFARHGPGLVLLARQRLGADEAEDVVQEVFVKLARLQDIPRDPAGYLFAAVRNGCRSRLRGRLRRRRRETVAARDRAGWFEPDESMSLDAARAEAALRGLPVAQREALVLRLWGGLSVSQAAEALGVGKVTVHRRQQAGLAALRKAMGVERTEPAGASR